MATDQFYSSLFTPLDIGPFSLPNRIIMGSMHTGLEGSAAGMARLARFYRARVEGGAGLIITGGHSVNFDGNLGELREEMASEADAVLHRPVTAAVHEAGGRIALQLLHAGRYSYHDHAVAPSALRSPINKATPRALTEDDIAQTIEDFANAAALAQEADYDGVEIMGSEGYLISSFLAPRANQREDDWGGSFENRMRFPLEIIRRCRARTGAGFLLIFRLSVLELVEGGMSGAEVLTLARAAEEAGADILNSGIGWHEARIPTIAQPVPPAAFVWATERVKDAVSIPIAAANKIHTPADAEAVIAEGRADLVSMARPFLADPDLPAKAKRGEAGRINICISCNQACLDHYFEGKSVSCLVNPAAAREAEFDLMPARSPLRLAVVGGGVAGMSAALTAARRGHFVTLYEASGALGGQFKLAAEIPGKEVFEKTIGYFAAEMTAEDVTVKTGASVTTASLAADGAEAVIVATGVVPRRPEIPGLESHPNVLTYAEALTAPERIFGDVLVLGAGGIGHDVCLFLLNRQQAHHRDIAAFNRHWGVDPTGEASGGLAPGAAKARLEEAQGPRITMMKRSPGPFGRSLGRTTGWVHRLEIRKAGIATIAGADYRSVDTQGLTYDHSGEARTLAADTIILCTGQVAVDALAVDLAESGLPVQTVGGARLAGELDAKRAIEEGMRAAMAI
ncbi:MAG: NADPH-dependent 2,4-dienoyl-CoA reductase [Alphaproteobacteria bacterium]|nr:NADPH-dependent 2,4-dienoyl-CoA reductase [Alphaproteobacteria bacterium]